LRKWSKGEKRLSIVLGLAILVMGSFYVVSYLLDIESDLTLKIRGLEANANTDQVWLREKQFWLDRKKWIDQKQPRVAAGAVPQSELLQSLTTSAQNHKLTIQEQSFADAKSTANYQAVAVRLKLTGTLEDVVRWLAEVQQPEKFQAVTNFSLKSQAKPPAVDLELEVARWYSPHA
jgi:Type II secretion system (T2SS), protein M subtype b